jgi:hypothetical protein
MSEGLIFRSFFIVSGTNYSDCDRQQRDRYVPSEAVRIPSEKSEFISCDFSIRFRPYDRDLQLVYLIIN